MLLLSFKVIEMITDPLFQIKLYDYVLSYPVDFTAPRELWNPLRKAVPDKFHGFGGHSKTQQV